MRRLLRVVAPAVLLLFMLASAPPANAAFPGRNGLLAVAPLRGSGLLLVSATGRHPLRVCTSVQLCGTPATPRFSPDGQDIAFVNARTGAPGVIAVDGICMWCLLSSPLTGLTGSEATFTGDGLAVALATRMGLWRLPLTPKSPRRVLAGRLAASVWGSGGTFAFVRSGSIWVLSPGHAPRRLASGADPDFSPTGREVVFDSGGWIWSISTAGGAAERLIRGQDPVLSPDGQELAFLGAGGQVYVAGARGRHPRRLTGVRGRSLDWQPLPRRTHGTCAVPPGSTVVARSAEALVTADPATPASPWYGCLRATGVRRRLDVLPSGVSAAALEQIALAGRFVAAAFSSQSPAGVCTNKVISVDLATLAPAAHLYSRSCDPGVQGIDWLGLDASGFVAWHAREVVATPQVLLALACPSTSFCVAADVHGNIATSASPAGPWTLSHVAPGLAGLSCPSSASCVGWSGPNVTTSSDPASTWSAPTAVTAATIAGLACPTTTQCAAVDDAGNLLAGDPADLAAWTATRIDTASAPTAVACPGAELCVAADAAGRVITGDPASPASWAAPYAAESEPLGAITSLACVPSATTCVATTAAGAILGTHDARVPAAWTVTAPAGTTAAGARAACAGASLCAVSSAGQVLTSTAPLTGPWTGVALGGDLVALACAPSGAPLLCAATDTTGGVWSSTQPDTPSWQRRPVDVPPCGACIAEQLFVQDDRGRQAVDAAQPGAGGVLADFALSGNSTTVTWTHSGAPGSFTLR